MEKEKPSAQHISALAEYGLEGSDISDISLFMYKSGEFILQQGYPCPYILILLEGRMKVFNTVLSGRTLLSCYYATSGILGEVEFALEASSAASSVQAVTDVSCIAIPIARYKSDLKGNITFMNAVSAALAQKLFLSSRDSAAAILHTLDARLCAYIAMTNTGGCFREKLTELSEILGTSYRHLLRTLNNLCLRGVLEKTPRGYLIIDEAELGRISDDCYLK